MKQYRIIQKYWRDDDTAQIKDYYIIQYSGIDLLKSIFYLKKQLKWKPYEIEQCYYECHKEVIRFDTKKEIVEYRNNLEKPIPKDKCVK